MKRATPQVRRDLPQPIPPTQAAAATASCGSGDNALPSACVATPVVLSGGGNHPVASGRVPCAAFERPHLAFGNDKGVSSGDGVGALPLQRGRSFEPEAEQKLARVDALPNTSASSRSTPACVARRQTLVVELISFRSTVDFGTPKRGSR